MGRWGRSAPPSYSQWRTRRFLKAGEAQMPSRLLVNGEWLPVLCKCPEICFIRFFRLRAQQLLCPFPAVNELTLGDGRWVQDAIPGGRCLKLPMFCTDLLCPQNQGASLVAQTVKNLPGMLETWVHSLGQEDPLEKGMATHSSILA